MCLLGVAVILLFLIEISIKLIHSCFCMRGTQVYPQYIILSLLLSLCPCVSVPVPFLVYLSASFGSLGPFPCVPTPVTVPVPAPITVPMSLFFFLSLPMFMSLFLTLSLCPCVLVSRPLSLQLYSVIFCSMSTSDPPSSDNSLVSQLRLKEATILVTFVETLVTLRPPQCSFTCKRFANRRQSQHWRRREVQSWKS